MQTTHNILAFTIKAYKTRKSSCVNARGIPTAAYQVLPRCDTPSCQGTPPVGVSPTSWLGSTQGIPPSGYPPPVLARGGTQGIPPSVDRQKDRHESKHNLPIVLRTRSVINRIKTRPNRISGKPKPWVWKVMRVWLDLYPAKLLIIYVRHSCR